MIIYLPTKYHIGFGLVVSQNTALAKLLIHVHPTQTLINNNNAIGMSVCVCTRAQMSTRFQFLCELRRPTGVCWVNIEFGRRLLMVLVRRGCTDRTGSTSRDRIVRRFSPPDTHPPDSSRHANTLFCKSVK